MELYKKQKPNEPPTAQQMLAVSSRLAGEKEQEGGPGLIQPCPRDVARRVLLHFQAMLQKTYKSFTLPKPSDMFDVIEGIVSICTTPDDAYSKYIEYIYDQYFSFCFSAGELLINNVKRIAKDPRGAK
jgi:hypothetical protein